MHQSRIRVRRNGQRQDVSCARHATDGARGGAYGGSGPSGMFLAVVYPLRGS